MCSYIERLAEAGSNEHPYRALPEVESLESREEIRQKLNFHEIVGDSLASQMAYCHKNFYFLELK